jgi:hypothetical protein
MTTDEHVKRQRTRQKATNVSQEVMDDRRTRHNGDMVTMTTEERGTWRPTNTSQGHGVNDNRRRGHGGDDDRRTRQKATNTSQEAMVKGDGDVNDDERGKRRRTRHKRPW